MSQQSVSVAEPPAQLQRLVDQAAGFNLFAVPERSCGPDTRAGEVVGFQWTETLHRFEVDLEMPTESGVRAVNAAGEAAGRLELRWAFIPHDFRALPDREPPATRLDRGRSQRFTLLEATFRFGDGRDGFRSFGAGRTFPYDLGGEPKLLAGAVGNLTDGFGRFAGHEGNYTLCGEVTPEGGFLGHVLVRVQDSQGNLRTSADLPPPGARLDPDPQTTYLLWAGQKGRGPDQENRFSVGADGQVRGLNIPTELKRLRLDFAAESRDGFRARDFQAGEVVGREIGFGRGSEPGASPAGTPLRPFLFEGVARYGFHDGSGREVGALTTNVLEGRRFDMQLPGAPDEVAWRFGFFGPVVLGTGCFQGVQGMFYGASGSILKPPPGEHVITHFYVARLHDPGGRFRAGGRS